MIQCPAFANQSTGRTSLVGSTLVTAGQPATRAHGTESKSMRGGVLPVEPAVLAMIDGKHQRRRRPSLARRSRLGRARVGPSNHQRSAWTALLWQGSRGGHRVSPRRPDYDEEALALPCGSRASLLPRRHRPAGRRGHGCTQPSPPRLDDRDDRTQRHLRRLPGRHDEGVGLGVVCGHRLNCAAVGPDGAIVSLHRPSRSCPGKSRRAAPGSGAGLGCLRAGDGGASDILREEGCRLRSDPTRRRGRADAVHTAPCRVERSTSRWLR